MKDAVKPGNVSFRVGPWTVEPALHRLERAGEAVRVEPKVMEVLVHLVSRAPAVVSREELQEAVWGTPYVSEDLPRRAVYELRKVFRDDPQEPRFIETIPRAGYRLVATVAPQAAAGPPSPAGSATGAPTTGDVPASRFRWRRLAPLLGAVLLAAAALLPGFLRTDSAPATARFRPTPLTALPGLEYDPVLSPDGTRVAFLRVPDMGEEAEMTLHVQLVGTASSLRVSDQPGGFSHPIESPTWSPDGTEIAYRRWRDGEGWGIYSVPALGGSERELVVLGEVEVSGLAWSPDGRWFAVGLRAGDEGPLAVYRVALDTLERERVTDPPATIDGDALPAWSPDGGSLAFVRNVYGEASEVRVVAASGGGSRSVLPGRHKIADVDWSPDGRSLLVAVHEGGRHRLWRVDVATGAVRRMTEVGDDTRWISVARRDGRLAYGRARWEFEIHRYDLTTGEWTPVPGLSSTFYDEALDVSPSGDRVALVSTRSGNLEIWTSDLEGRRPLQLTRFEGARVGQPRWLPDGRSIVFHADAEGRSDLWRVAADGHGLRRLTGVGGDDRVPSVSRDGRWIYFASDRTGDWEVWRVAAAGGEPEQVTRSGGYVAHESPDGDWLYYTRWKTGGLWRMPVGGGTEERVLGEALSRWDWGNWAVAPEGVYFLTSDGGGPVSLALYSPQKREVVRRFPLTSTPVQPSLALSPTGDTVLLAELDRIESDVVLVDGFDEPAIE